MKVKDIIVSTFWVSLGIIILRKVLWDEFSVRLVGSSVLGAFFGALLFHKFAFRLMEAFGTFLYERMPQVSLVENENLMLQEKANYLVGRVAIGGRLTLTNERLLFHPHRFNIGGQVKEFSVAEVVQLDRGEGRYDKVLTLTLSNKDIQKFVVEEPLNWLEAIPPR